MKYIVFWSLFRLVSDPCPNRAQPDKFGVMPSTYMSCAVYHCHSEFLGKRQQVFFNRDSAKLFYAEAFNRSKQIFSHEIDSVRIDSLKNILK